MNREPIQYEDIDVDGPMAVDVDVTPRRHDADYPRRRPEQAAAHRQAPPRAMGDEAPAQPQQRPTAAQREAFPDGVDDPLWNEALGLVEVTVRHDGMTFTLPSDPADWPIKATESFETGKIVSAVRALVKPREFAALEQRGYRNTQFAKLFDALAVAGGFGSAGN